jgi:Domain of unknown function (DUF4105)
MRIAAFFFLLLGLACTHPLPAFAGDPLAHGLEANDPLWRALLHFSGSRSSAAPGAPFFLSPKGHEDPAAELAATLEYFREQPAAAACRFPARAMALGLGKREDDSPICQRWHKWREALSAKGIELVFAAAFINSPSSMYGHTLLKFPRSGKTEGEELLDYTLNYGADTGNAVGLPYVVAGLTGGFNGRYSTAPFYLKVREYNFVENRDFWIYPLTVSETQLQLLAAHAWELRDVDFPYFFLHRNCSFYLLEFLEVARPGAGLTDSFPLWAVPMDTIRRLEADAWIGTPHYRPSRYRRLQELRGQLNSGEAALAKSLSLSGKVADLPPGREGLLLDAAYELWRYRNESRSGADPAVERLLLTERSQVRQAPFAADYSQEVPPEQGHTSSRASLALGLNADHAFSELSYRLTLHDLLAPPLGYEEGSELSMGDLRARVEARRIFLERADLLRLRSLSPRDQWFPKTAWSFRVFSERAKEFSCSDWHCLDGGMEGGAGLSANPFGSLLMFALLEGGVEAGGVFDRGYRISAGPSAGLFLPLFQGSRLLLEAEWRFRLLGSTFMRHRAKLGISQSLGRLWELRAQGEVNRGYREALLGGFYYF